MHISQWFSVPAFDPDECDRAQEICNQETLTRTNLYKNCKVSWIRPDGINEWLYEKIDQLFTDVNKNTFRFKLDGELEPLQYLEFGFGHYSEPQFDNGQDITATRKMTMIIQLTNTWHYGGGSVRIYGEKPKLYAPRERGHIAVFPSHLAHRSERIFYGKRRVLVAWKRGVQHLR